MTPAASPTPGHYSPVVHHAGLLFVSGVLPIVPGEAPRPAQAFDDQVDLAMARLLEILGRHGARASDLLKTTAYIVGAHRWNAFDTRYARALGVHKPARTVVPVAELHYGLLVEIDAIAAAPGHAPLSFHPHAKEPT